MATNHNPMIAVVWTQFTAYHTDRCIALTARLRGRAEVVAVEVASTSHDYGDFSQTGEIQGVRKVTLFPGESFDEVAPWRRFSALFGVLLQCRIICLGVPYSHLEVVLLAWLLRLLGKKLVMLCDSKFDDRPRAAGFEFAKRLGLSCFNAAIFASARSKEYLSFLGFANRPLLPGYDGVGIERYRNEATQSELRPVPFAQRDLLFRRKTCRS